jgi:hypothetical protein
MRVARLRWWPCALGPRLLTTVALRRIAGKNLVFVSIDAAPARCLDRRRSRGTEAWRCCGLPLFVTAGSEASADAKF